MYIPFHVVENSFFRELLAWFSPKLAKEVPRSYNVIKGWIMDAFKEKKIEIKTMISRLKSNIHLSFDLWTLDNSLALLGVVAHFVDKDYQLRTIMLALRRITGSYSGENLAYTLEQIIEEFEITGRLGYFVLDNAESNNTCIEYLLKNIAPYLQKKHRRLRCIGHIINLAA